MDSLILLSRYQEDANVAISAYSLFDPLFRRRMNVYVCKVPSILEALKDQVIERIDEWTILTTAARFPQFFSFVPCMYLSIKQSLLYRWLVWNSGYSSPSKRTGSFYYLDIKRTPTSLYRLVLYLTPCFAAEWTYIFARFLWFWLHWKARSLKGWTSELFLNFTFAI